MIRKNSITAFLLFSFISCTPAKYKKENERFKDYLNTYKVTISDTKHSYIIFYSHDCAGCDSKIMNFLNNKKIANCTVITGNNDIHVKGYPIIYDSLKQIDKINIGTANVTIVSTKNNHIYYIKELNPHNLDSFFYFITI